MTVAVTRTKAEQALSQSFEAVAAKLPGSGAVADARKAAIGSFAALGLPHRRIEEWKFTDLRVALKDALPPAVGEDAPVSAQAVDAALGALAALDAARVVFVNGAYQPQLSNGGSMAGCEVTPVSAVIDRCPEFGAGRGMSPKGQEAVVALNTAFVTDGAVVRISDGAELAKPLLLVFLRAGGEGRLVTTRNILKVGARAKAVVVEAHVSLPGVPAGQANTLSAIEAEDGANVQHIKCTLEGMRTTHLGSWLTTLGADTIYNGFQLTAGTGLVRNHVAVTFRGEGAKLDLSGAFLGRGSEHIDTTLVVDHAVGGCESRELFKGVLADRARGVFQGKVIVRPDAQKTDGKQMAQVLMLSEEAEFDSKPELEIHANDVICGHGSTSAEIDPEMLFYLRSRGIPVAEARALLIESFVAEAIEQIEDEDARAAVLGLAKGWLAGLVTEA